MSEFLRDLYCGLSNDHIVKEPITLTCGHSICKQCVHDQVKIKCKICSEESALNKTMIKSSLSGLFEELEERATNEINLFKS